MKAKPLAKTSSLPITEADEGKRLDAVLASAYPEQSRGYYQKLIEQGFALVNSIPVNKVSHVLKAGDTVTLTARLAESLPEGEDVNLEILYEDEAILVINKPVDLTVHPTPLRSTGTLVNALLHHDSEIGKALYDPESSVSAMRPGIVHRLDRDTSGVMVIAKTKEALMNLAEQFHNHTVEKEYLALVFGIISQPESVRANIRRKSATKNMMGVSKSGEEGRAAVTHITPIESFEYNKTGDFFTLISCKIETGRTHQIRVHCKYIGFPVVGDQVYSNKPARKVSELLGAHRQMLHASKLTIKHPTSSEVMTFSAPAPQDMLEILTKLRGT